MPIRSVTVVRYKTKGNIHGDVAAETTRTTSLLTGSVSEAVKTSKMDCRCLHVMFLLILTACLTVGEIKVESICKKLEQDSSLHLTCGPAQYIAIQTVSAGARGVDCRVNRSVECNYAPPNITQLPQVTVCNGNNSCNVSLQLVVQCNNKAYFADYALEIEYQCLGGNYDVKSSGVPNSVTLPTSAPSQYITPTAVRISESSTAPTSDEVPTVFPRLNIEASILPNKDVLLSSVPTTDDATSTGPRDQTTDQSAVLPVFLIAASAVMGVLVIAVLAVLCVMCGCRKCGLTHKLMATASQPGHIIPMPVPKNLVGTTWQEHDGYWELDPADVHNVSPVAVESDTGYAELNPAESEQKHISDYLGHGTPVQHVRELAQFLISSPKEDGSQHILQCPSVSPDSSLPEARLDGRGTDYQQILVQGDRHDRLNIRDTMQNDIMDIRDAKQNDIMDIRGFIIDADNHYDKITFRKLYHVKVDETEADKPENKD
ncbi:uncharacterized protein LOC124112368 [Haliotis rufescens]|uniref:uncharacterized protein LOC124112368 n=1 Tax=Haliotis rufescens TaxID=6454 RepID=UPI00201EC985|nr:uncharacterized protein LOC124112368 [Haliotis rufescens]